MATSDREISEKWLCERGKRDRQCQSQVGRSYGPTADHAEVWPDFMESAQLSAAERAALYPRRRGLSRRGYWSHGPSSHFSGGGALSFQISRATFHEPSGCRWNSTITLPSNPTASPSASGIILAV